MPFRGLTQYTMNLGRSIFPLRRENVFIIAFAPFCKMASRIPIRHLQFAVYEFTRQLRVIGYHLQTNGKKCEIRTIRFAIGPLNPQYIHYISILYISIVWKYTIIMDNQKSTLFPIKVHTISILWIFKIFSSVCN